MGELGEAVLLLLLAIRALVLRPQLITQALVLDVLLLALVVLATPLETPRESTQLAIPGEFGDELNVLLSTLLMAMESARSISVVIF